MERVKPKKKERGFKKGMAKIAGRAKGTPNRMTVLIKDGIEQSLRVIGDSMALKAEENPERYGLYAQGGVVAGLVWLAMKNPAAYIGMVSKLLPMQLTGDLTGKVTHRYETTQEVLDAFKARGLPPPAKLIDVTPTRPPPRSIDYVEEDDDDEDEQTAH